MEKQGIFSNDQVISFSGGAGESSSVDRRLGQVFWASASVALLS